MRYSSALTTVVLAALVSAGCGSGTPTAPSDALGASLPGALGDVATALETRALTGEARDVLSAIGVAGVTLRIPEIAEAATDAAGTFSLQSEAADGRYRVVASGTIGRRAPDDADFSRRPRHGVADSLDVQRRGIRRDDPAVRLAGRHEAVAAGAGTHHGDVDARS